MVSDGQGEGWPAACLTHSNESNFLEFCSGSDPLSV